MVVAKTLSNVSSSGPSAIDPLLTIDERNNVRRSIAMARAERNDIRQSIEKAEAELQSLLVRRKKVTKNISQLKKTLVIHRILPREIIGYIFSISRAEQVPIPHKQDKIPPQITVSHVCSKWREIALATPSLWNDVAITQPSDNWVQVAVEHLFNRAGIRGVNLALDMEEISSNKMKNIVYDLVLPLHVKKLHLTLPLSALERLSQESEYGIIANIDEIALSLTPQSKLVPFATDSNQVSIMPQFLSKIRSLTILGSGHQAILLEHLDLQNLPWTQIRHLCCNVILTLSTISGVLRQSPFLNVCGIKVEPPDEEEPTTVLTLPQLRIFHIFIEDGDQDTVLRSFNCPNLTDFRFETSYWTPETYKIIQNHYNLHRLLRFETSQFPFPISKVLSDAPMLQEFILGLKIFVDERALQGIASGELGRCLTSLWFSGTFNVKSVLNMLVSRQRHVKQVVEASRSWQDQHISGIKWIFLLNDDEDEDTLVQLKDELEKLGVIVYRSLDSVEPIHLHPLFSLDVGD